MDLEQFFPYRLARAAETVSQALALIYNERFELTRDEWRVLAALPEWREAKTMKVSENSSLDKMRAGACHAGRPSSRCPCAACAVSKMCGATPRRRSASPSLLRRKALVVYRETRL